MIIATVLKTGGDFDSEYVERLYESIPHNGRFVCFTDDPDVPSYIPQIQLEHGWPKWWSKIEMLGCGDDILYFDLDTIITGSLDKMMYVANKGWDKLIMLSDFYFPDKPASGIMYIPKEVGVDLYERFLSEPDFFMNRHRGDQDFISAQWNDIDRWDVLLGKDYICSYKAHIKKSHPNHIKPMDVNHTKSSITVFHGKPRPKDVSWQV